jgi:hypothetical protein
MSDEFADGSDKHPLDQLVGPFQNVNSATAYLSDSRAELAFLVESGRPIETKVGNGAPFARTESPEQLPELGDEHVVAFAGDWHGNGVWAAGALSRLNKYHPEVRTVLHAGDFGIFPGRHADGFIEAVDAACRSNGITRILVTPGNHEDWAALDAVFTARPGRAVRITERIWVLPRAYRFTVGDRRFLSFGGAASVDYEYRIAGESWWASEIPTDYDVRNAVAGPVDVLVTHDAVDGGTPRVELALATNPGGWPVEALGYSALSRGRVTRVWTGTHAKVLVHGHMHIRDEIELEDGRQVISLGCDEQSGNIGVLDLRSLEWSWVAEDQPPEGTRLP